MSEFLKKLFEIDKTPTKVLLLFSVITGGLLFLPANFLEQLKLQKLEEQYGHIFGLVFLLTTGMIVINICIWIITTISNRKGKSRFRNSIQNSLENLDEQEKATLREFAIKGQNTIQLPIDDAVVSGLMRKGILRQVSSLGRPHLLGGLLFPMEISKIAADNLTLEHLDLSKEPSDELRDRVLNSRPKWAKEMDDWDRY